MLQRNSVSWCADILKLISKDVVRSAGWQITSGKKRFFLENQTGPPQASPLCQDIEHSKERARISFFGEINTAVGAKSNRLATTIEQILREIEARQTPTLEPALQPLARSSWLRR